MARPSRPVIGERPSPVAVEPSGWRPIDIDYRLYCRDGKHHIQDVILLRCASDGEAIIASHRRAARFLSCNLWAGGREIERFGE